MDLDERLSPRGEKITSLIILLIFAPAILYASSFPLTLAAKIIGDSATGIIGFAFALPVTLLLMFSCMRMLAEIGVECKEILPSLKFKSESPAPSLGLAALVSVVIMGASGWLWWNNAFPPGELLAKGKAIQMRTAKVTQSLTNDGRTSYYSQQVWLKPMAVQGSQEDEIAKQFPLLAPRWIDEDAQLASLQKPSSSYDPDTPITVWTMDAINGPFYERLYNAGAFAALLWWLSAALAVFSEVSYLNLKARNSRQTSRI